MTASPKVQADDFIAVRQEGQALGNSSAVSALNSSMRISLGRTMSALMAYVALVTMVAVFPEPAAAPLFFGRCGLCFVPHYAHFLGSMATYATVNPMSIGVPICVDLLGACLILSNARCASDTLTRIAHATDPSPSPRCACADPR